MFLVQINLWSFYSVNSIQLQEFTPVWICKSFSTGEDAVAVNLKKKKTHTKKRALLHSSGERGKKTPTTNMFSVLVNLRVLQQVGMCTSATVYMQTAFIYVL